MERLSLLAGAFLGDVGRGRRLRGFLRLRSFGVPRECRLVSPPDQSDEALVVEVLELVGESCDVDLPSTVLCVRWQRLAALLSLWQLRRYPARYLNAICPAAGKQEGRPDSHPTAL
jgi:hypothetical protein